jgi:hypothetical protein
MSALKRAVASTRDRHPGSNQDAENKLAMHVCLLFERGPPVSRYAPRKMAGLRLGATHSALAQLQVVGNSAKVALRF